MAVKNASALLRHVCDAIAARTDSKRRAQVWKKEVDQAAEIWMQKLKRLAHNEDEGMFHKDAKAAGISTKALNSIDRVLLFEWPMFVALTHQRCALCHRPFGGKVSEIGSYIHTACRSS